MKCERNMNAEHESYDPGKHVLCSEKRKWQPGQEAQIFACFVCQDCHKKYWYKVCQQVTGHVCVNSNVNNPYSAFLTDKTVPLNASTSLTVPVYVTVTLSPSFTSESPSGF